MQAYSSKANQVNLDPADETKYTLETKIDAGVFK